MRKNTTKMLSLSLSALLLLGSSSCFMEKKIASAELSKDYARAATNAGEITENFKTNLADFSMSLFKKSVTKNEKNDLVSPLSAALCLALINNGAAGNTRAQLEALFGMETNELNRSLYAYTSSLETSKDCEVHLANSVWFKENALNVKPNFLQSNADWYGAQAYASPFDNSTLQDINNWCHNQTKGKIDKILDNIDANAVMYLINALDFDAKWQTKYERKDVSDQTFYNYNGTESNVKMLHSEESRYLMTDDCVGFTKAYKGGNYSFVGILPNEDVDVYDYIESLNGEKWNTLWESADSSREDYVYREVHARMPEFTYETEFILNEVLQSLGVTDMFSADYADFSNIDDTQPLYCALVKQKTFIQHDRNGTKAAAITIGGMKCMSAAPAEPLYITLDRPFVYAIIDNTHKLPLFLGAVTNL